MYEPKRVHTGPVVKEAMWNRPVWVVFFIIVFVSVFAFIFFESKAQNCITTIRFAQIGSLDDPDMSATVPPEVKKMDQCVYSWTVPAALSLGASSVAAAALGAILSNRFRAEQSTRISAHYEPDARKLVLRFDRPVMAQNPQRMVLLYRHVDGMGAAVPGRQCGNSGLTLAFTTDVEKPPTHMELVVCSGAMHPAGFPELDVCAGGRPIHVDVDILLCDK